MAQAVAASLERRPPPSANPMDVSHSSNQSPQPDSTQLAQDRLQQMAHFQAGFLGTASHELRAPINKIISLHQLILEDLCENPEEEREFVEQANQAIFQVLQNLDLLIQVSKFDIGAVNPKLQPVFVQGVLDQVQQLTKMKCLTLFNFNKTEFSFLSEIGLLLVIVGSSGIWVTSPNKK